MLGNARNQHVATGGQFGKFGDDGDAIGNNQIRICLVNGARTQLGFFVNARVARSFVPKFRTCSISKKSLPMMNQHLPRNQ